MRITKVKIVGAGDEVEIAYTEDRNGLHVESALKSEELPHPDLITPFNALRHHVLKLLGFDVSENMGPGEDPDDWIMRSVRYKHRDEYTEVEFTLMRPVPTHTRVLVINTPGWKMADAEEADEDGPLSAPLRRLLRNVRSEARAYIDGKKSQGELWEGDENEEAA